MNLKRILTLGPLAACLWLNAPAMADGVKVSPRGAVTSNAPTRPLNPTPAALPHWPGVLRTQFQTFVVAAQLSPAQIEAVRAILEQARLRHQEMHDTDHQPANLRHFDNGFAQSIRAQITRSQFRIFAARIGSPYVFAAIANHPPHTPIENSQG